MYKMVLFTLGEGGGCGVGKVWWGAGADAGRSTGSSDQQTDLRACGEGAIQLNFMGLQLATSTKGGGVGTVSIAGRHRLPAYSKQHRQTYTLLT